MSQDVYFNKVVDFTYARQKLSFRLSQALFSSFDVDVGTQRLLRALATTDIGPARKVLDLGCGYGPIGLSLKKAAPERTVHLVDRDALAVDYARQNAALNDLEVEVYGSLGYDDVTADDFDLIVSNLPAKAGEPVLVSMMHEAAWYLQPEGRVAIVVVTPLEPLVREVLSDPGIQLLFEKSWPGHTVFLYRFTTARSPRPEQSAFERGVYGRQEVVITFPEGDFPMQTVYNLPEFDTLSYETELLLEGLLAIKEMAVERTLSFNPGQGHGPVAMWKLWQPGALFLAGRDLLSLRNTRENLLRNGCPEAQITLSHQAGLLVPGAAPADLVAGVLREEEGTAALTTAGNMAIEQLAQEGRVLLVGSSTAVTRLADAIEPARAAVIKRERRRGKSRLLLRRK